jgi:Tol biopolymer transport system component
VPRTVVWVERNGKELPTAAPPHSYFYARVSPDDRKLALDVREGEGDVWIWDVRGTMRRLTESNGTDQYAIWTPDGARIVFQSDIKQRPGIYVTRADAIGEPTQILERAAAFPNAVTPDGRSVIFRATSTTTKNDLFVMAIDGPERPVTPLLQTPHDELNAALSPDGKWMAFESDATGRFEIYVRSYPDIQRVQEVVSTAGGSEPVWAPGGRELFYVGADNRLHMVAITAGAGGKASFSAPVALFDTRPYFFGGLGRNYDISNDGKRFAMIKDDQAKAPAPDSLRIVLHWAEELKSIRAR